jgi:hypothetical protein
MRGKKKGSGNGVDLWIFQTEEDRNNANKVKGKCLGTVYSFSQIDELGRQYDGFFEHFDPETGEVVKWDDLVKRLKGKKNGTVNKNFISIF